MSAGVLTHDAALPSAVLDCAVPAGGQEAAPNAPGHMGTGTGTWDSLLHLLAAETNVLLKQMCKGAQGPGGGGEHTSVASAMLPRAVMMTTSTCWQLRCC